MKENMKVLITAGPTIERIDLVRYITNHSSGKQGYEIASCMSNAGWDVSLVSGPVNILNKNIEYIYNVSTGSEMLAQCNNLLPTDVAIFVAAVTDWKPKYYHSQKLKKYEISNIEIEYNQDMVLHISTHSLRPKLVICFALESENLIQNARIKLSEKKCDWVIVNCIKTDLIGDVMGSDYNKITIIKCDNSYKEFPVMKKSEVANVILNEIERYFKM